MDKATALGLLSEMLDKGLIDIEGVNDELEEYLTEQGIDWPGKWPDELIGDVMEIDS